MRRTLDISRRRWWLVPTAACLFVVAGCSSGEDGSSSAAESPSPTATSEGESASEERDEVAVTVTFDGATCVYDGPIELTPGVVLIEFVNDSEAGAETVVARLDEDATFDEFVEFHQPEPKVTGPPDFVTLGVGGTGAEAGEIGSIRSFLENGEYGLVCLQGEPGDAEPSVWVAQPGGVAVAD